MARYDLLFDRLRNDRWRGSFTVDTLGTYQYTLTAWVDPFLTWQHDLLRRQVTLIGSWTFSTVGQMECARYIADRGVAVDKLFTHRWTLDQAVEGIVSMTKGGNPAKINADLQARIEQLERELAAAKSAR